MTGVKIKHAEVESPIVSVTTFSLSSNETEFDTPEGDEFFRIAIDRDVMSDEWPATIYRRGEKVGITSATELRQLAEAATIIANELDRRVG